MFNLIAVIVIIIIVIIVIVIQLKYHNKVIIMEMCTGSSLYEVIDSPDNAYGLAETDFKQVIYDVGEDIYI